MCPTIVIKHMKKKKLTPAKKINCPCSGWQVTVQCCYKRGHSTILITYRHINSSYDLCEYRSYPLDLPKPCRKYAEFVYRRSSCGPPEALRVILTAVFIGRRFTSCYTVRIILTSCNLYIINRAIMLLSKTLFKQ